MHSHWCVLNLDASALCPVNSAETFLCKVKNSVPVFSPGTHCRRLGGTSLLLLLQIKVTEKYCREQVTSKRRKFVPLRHDVRPIGPTDRSYNTKSHFVNCVVIELINS
jgi:hypothetical protein